MFEVTADLALILILAAFVAGFVDSIAGGGGLITVPILLLAGASPLQALATNKVQGSFGAATAAFTYARTFLTRRHRCLGSLRRRRQSHHVRAMPHPLVTASDCHR
jgi:uncharacterized protein